MSPQLCLILDSFLSHTFQGIFLRQSTFDVRSTEQVIMKELFKPVHTIFSVLHLFGGFPYKLTKTGFDLKIFPEFVRTLFFLLSSTFTILLAYITIAVQNGGPFDFFYFVTEKTTFSVMDMCMNFTFFACGYLHSFIALWCYMIQRPAINDLIWAINSLHIYKPIPICGLEIKRRLKYALLLMTLTSICYCCYTSKLSYAITDNKIIQFTMAINSLINITTFYPSSSLGTLLFIQYLLALLIKCTEQLEVERDRVFTTVKSNINSKNIIRNAEQVLKLLKMGQSALEPFLVWHYLVCLICSTIGGFTGSGIIFTGNDKSRIFISAANIFMTILYMQNLYHTSKSGQKLQNQVDRIIERLETESRGAKIIEDQDELFHLAKKFERFKALCPYGMFYVNNASFLAVVGTIISYLIVLMQFKISEVSLKK